MSLGSAKLGHVELAQRFDDLHQLLYTRGGIRPSNAAVEELTKLLLMRIAADRHPNLPIGQYGLLSEVIDPSIVRRLPDPASLKEAFKQVNALPGLGARIPDNGVQPVWPTDEPLRITRSDIAAESLEILLSIPLGHGETLDALGTAFDAFLRGKYEHSGGLGTYLTPNTVVQTMVEVGFALVDPFIAWDGATPVMGDPCCGSGRFLIGMIEHARNHSGIAIPDQLHHSLVGADQSASSVAMANVNLLAYGLPPAEVFMVEDSITNEALDRLRGKLRLILTNPPFGEQKYDSAVGIRRTARLFDGVASKNRIDPSIAFVSRCIDLLAQGGVAGIILPDGVADGTHMRDLLLSGPRLIDAVQLEGVISLPVATFAPAGTVAKTSVIFIRKGPSTQRRVFLARADHVGHVMRKGVAAPDPDGDDLPQLANDVCVMVQSTSHASPATGRIALVDVGILTAVDAASVDADALKARQALAKAGGHQLGTVLRVAKRRRVSHPVDLPFVSVLHVDELGNVDWLQAEVYCPTTPGILARSGQIIVSLLNPAKFRATVIPDRYAEAQCSAEFGVFDSSIDPYAALALLQHKLVRIQIAPLGRGTSSSRRRIDGTDVLGLIAPPYDESWIEKTGNQVAEALTAVAEARSDLIAAYGA